MIKTYIYSIILLLISSSVYSQHEIIDGEHDKYWIVR